MLAVCMALGPLTGENPLLDLLAGGVMAVVTGVARAPVPLLVGPILPPWLITGG